MRNDLEVRDVVVLVHGTWGRGFFGWKSDASWCEPSSACTAAVRDGLGQHLQIDVFRWSGRNNARARRRATVELIERIAQLRGRYQQARVHLIAHSHGGNIALYAAKRGAAFASITCFSTPFLLVEGRTNNGLFQGWNRWKSVGALLLLLPLLAVVWGASYVFRDAAFANWLGGLYLAGAVPFLVAGWMSTRTGDQVAALLEDLTLPTKDAVNSPTLIIRAPGDEASAVLAMAQLFSRMFAAVSRVLLYWRNVSIRWRVVWAVSFLVIPLAVFDFFGESIFRLPQISEQQIVVMLILGGTVAPVVTIVALVLPQFLSLLIAPLIGGAFVLTTLFLLPFGPIFAANSWRLQVASEGTPPGEWTVHQLTAGKLQGLRHGTHSDDRALELLTRWLRENFCQTAAVTGQDE